MDAKLPTGLVARLILPFSLWLMQRKLGATGNRANDAGRALQSP